MGFSQGEKSSTHKSQTEKHLTIAILQFELTIKRSSWFLISLKCLNRYNFTDRQHRNYRAVLHAYIVLQGHIQTLVTSTVETLSQFSHQNGKRKFSIFVQIINNME